MSLEAADVDEVQYYRKVELGWSLARGRQIIVSPLEFEEIEKWFVEGIPLPVVLRAIDLFVEKKNKAKRKRGYLLKDASTTVKKCWREYLLVHAGEGGEADLLTTKMKKLVTKIKRVSMSLPEFASFLNDLIQNLKAIPLHEVVAFDSIESKLSSLEVDMIAHFTVLLDADELAEIQEDLAAILTEADDPPFYKKMFCDTVRSHFGLPKLTLLG